MKSPDPKARLLDEVLTQNDGADFAQEALQRALGAARHRRRMRHVRHGLLTVAVVCAISLCFWQPVSKSPALVSVPPLPAAASVPAFGLVTTQPLPQGMLLQTQSNLVGWVKTDATSVTCLTTPAKESLFRPLTDDDLLALVAGQPAALVRHDLNHATLVMPEEMLQNGFTVAP